MVTMSERVLVVEDDESVREAVARGLELHGFSVTPVVDAETAMVEVGRRTIDVMIVDVGLPGMSGIELCRRLRERDVAVPLLVLSARDQVGDRVAGLQAGADDYMVKPFALDELVARLQALLRRSQRSNLANDPTVHVVGTLWIDDERRTARAGNQRLELSRREFDLLSALASHRNMVLSRIQLLELVWGYDFDVDTNVVDVFVGYLRKKLQAAGVGNMIETVRGVGFVLREPAT
jgi:two-component system response regulator PrrA